MKTIHFGNHSIKIPVSIPKDHLKRDERTSHLSHIHRDAKGDLPFTVAIHPQIRAFIKPYKSYLDLAAGIGTTASIYKSEDNTLNDLDSLCNTILKYNFPKALVTQFDYYNFPFTRDYDFICIDINNFTISRFPKAKDMFANIFKHAKDTVVICDSACFATHIEGNQKCYSKIFGSPITSAEDYFKACRKFYASHFPEWRLTLVVYIKNTSYMTFERTKTKSLTLIRSKAKETFTITENSLDDLE